MDFQAFSKLLSQRALLLGTYLQKNQNKKLYQAYGKLDYFIDPLITIRRYSESILNS
ncbi:hypothetical protein SGODD07_00054 [Streptococcus gordonii]|uniref:Uncharacterized protein n=1 Tax=Streptococcus gordonii TaxID=1302 RepID=A0A139NGJ1_STRGN|nr:hypothetical protein SGODD07_00054 [Streptococcus gordonii]